MWITVNGVELYYQKTGQGSPEVLLHGHGESHRIFDVLIRQLATRQTVYAPVSYTHLNPVTGEQVADNLTTTEFATAMLAVRGWTNQEIATHLGISVNTVKQHISSTLLKLGIKQRKDLKGYMLR